ncbi:nuclear transport factor 2 family protein [Marinomonas epiphytica]
MSATSKQQLIESFKDFYKDVKRPQLHKIAEVYSDDVIFKDPIHEVKGVDTLHAYLTEMSVNVVQGHFEYLDELIGEDTAYLKWNMHFSHKKLGPKVITLRGMTQVQFKERIYVHEDSYDLGALVYEHVPLVGQMVRVLKRRLSV